MAAFVPSLEAATHWLAPFPPNPEMNLLPCMVSPGCGSLGTKLEKVHLSIDFHHNMGSVGEHNYEPALLYQDAGGKWKEDCQTYVAWK